MSRLTPYSEDSMPFPISYHRHHGKMVRNFGTFFLANIGYSVKAKPTMATRDVI